MKKLSLYVFVILMFCNVGNALPKCKVNDAQWTNCQGTEKDSLGGIYVGEFKEDKYHGQGTYTHPSGLKYVGEYVDSKAHGQGTITYGDGSKYVGEWKEDNYHGQGTYTSGRWNSW